MLNPTLTPEDYEKIRQTILSDADTPESNVCQIPFSRVLEVNEISEDEFLSRLSDVGQVLPNALSNLSKAEKQKEKAEARYQTVIDSLDDDSIDYGKRAADFFGAQKMLNTSIDLVNVQRAHLHYVMSYLSKVKVEIEDSVNQRLSDVSDKF